MVERRAQGRPARGPEVVGRERILTGTREFLRSNKATEVTRKNIAGSVGVTPALISYYFPERINLLEAATVSVIEAHTQNVRLIAAKADPFEAKLRQLVGLFVQCHVVDGGIFSCFAEMVLPASAYDGEDLVELLIQNAAPIFDELSAQHIRLLTDSRTIVLALWGLCKSISQANARKVEASDAPMVDQLSAEQTELVYSLITEGIGRNVKSPERAPALVPKRHIALKKLAIVEKEM
jgi:AcrR family transcriptional regulator